MNQKTLVTADIRVKFSLQVNEDRGSWKEEKVLRLENVPGAWKIHGEPTETPAVGLSIEQAVLNFLSANYGGKKIQPKEMCKAYFDTLLERARPDQLEQAFDALGKVFVET